VLIANSAPPQSLLAKQRNLVPMVVDTADTPQNTMPLEGAEMELLMVNAMMSPLFFWYNS
jgi:hypothetical protein